MKLTPKPQLQEEVPVALSLSLSFLVQELEDSYTGRNNKRLMETKEVNLIFTPDSWTKSSPEIIQFSQVNSLELNILDLNNIFNSKMLFYISL
jgi:hypothetical protein